MDEDMSDTCPDVNREEEVLGGFRAIYTYLKQLWIDIMDYVCAENLVDWAN